MSGVLTSIFNFKHKVKLWGNGHGHCIFIRARAVGEISLAASYLEAGPGEGASAVPPSKIFQEKLLSPDFFGPARGLGGGGCGVLSILRGLVLCHLWSSAS